MRSVTPVKNRGDSADGEAVPAAEGRAQPSVAAKPRRITNRRPTERRTVAPGHAGEEGLPCLEHLTWEQIMLAASDRFMHPLEWFSLGCMVFINHCQTPN